MAINPAKDLIKLAAFEHIFSHFKLHIQPILVKTTGAQSLLDSSSKQGYYDLHSWQTLPIPKPVSTLLETLATTDI